MDAIDHYQCNVCGSRDTDKLIDILKVPVYCNVLYDTREEALNAAKGDLKLRYCPNCDHIFNSSFDSSLIDYNASYDNSLHFSPHFQKYADNLARDLASRYELDGKNVVEVACGKGDFLQLVGKYSNANLTGFDPSFDLSLGKPKNVTIIEDYFSAKYKNHDADFLICQHALEHMESPVDFLNAIKDSLPDGKTVSFYFEVPNSVFSVRDFGIWDFIYEHVSYFSARSLAQCFNTAEYTVQNIYDSFDGQYLSIEGNTSLSESDQSNHLTRVGEYSSDFAAKFEELVSSWRDKIATFQDSSHNFVVWGAGSKGVTFLNLLQVNSEEFPYIVDINPRKQGKFVAGTAQEVISPSRLSAKPIDTVVIMNPVYQTEIQKQLTELNVVSKMVSV